VLTALSLGNGSEFKTPIASRSQRGLESPPAIHEYLLNSKSLSAFLSFNQEALRISLSTNYADSYLLNKPTFLNRRIKDV